MSALLSVEMFLSMSDEIKDLKEQNKFLKSENKRLMNEMNNMQAELHKFKPSTSKVNPFPSTAPSKTGQGHPGYSRQSFPVQGLAPVRSSQQNRGVLPVGHPETPVRGGFPLRTPYSTPIRRPLPIQGQVSLGNPMNIGSGYPPRGPLPVRKAAPNNGFPRAPRAPSPLQFEYNHVPIRGRIPVGNPVTIRGAPASKNPKAVPKAVLSPIRRAVPVPEVNQAWKFPVKAWGYQPVCSQKSNPVSTSTQNRSSGKSHITLGAAYNQFKTVINASALPNKTSTQHKRPLPNPSIQPPIPVKKIRQEETKEPRFVCKIDTCMFSACKELPVFKSLHEHREHMNEAHPERFLCSRCPFSSNLRGSLKSHEQTHTKNDEQWKRNQFNIKRPNGALCTLCNIKFAIGTIANCNSRLKKHNEQFH